MNQEKYENSQEYYRILWKVLYKKGSDGWNDFLYREIGFELFKNCFSKDRKLYDDFYNNLLNNKLEKFREIVRFYYFWCKSPSLFKFLKPDFQLIVFFSIIENLMTKGEYKDLREWLFEKAKEGKIILENRKDLSRFLDEYDEKHGSGRKFKRFFKNYYDSEDAEKLRESVEYLQEDEYLDGENFVPLKDLDELVRIIQKLRNNFIHKAEDTISSLEDYEKIKEDDKVESVSVFLPDENRKRLYKLNMGKFHIDAIRFAFEKAVINFFKKSKTETKNRRIN